MSRTYSFWKNHPFSNWYSSTFTVDGVQYCCGEQYMMAQKANLFKDEEICRQIMNETSPAKMKALGKKIRRFDEQTWTNDRYELVKKGLREKFFQNPDLMCVLMGTGNRVIAEASPYDAIWGIGIGARHPDINRPEVWTGLNLLGKILMDLRDDFKKELN